MDSNSKGPLALLGPKPIVPVANVVTNSGNAMTTSFMAKNTNVKVRPGINKILPKELVNELLESQGKRKVE